MHPLKIKNEWWFFVNGGFVYVTAIRRKSIYTVLFTLRIMVTIPSQLDALFSGRIKEQDSSYLISVPKQDVESGILELGEMYRIAIVSAGRADVSMSKNNGLVNTQEDMSDFESVVTDDNGAQGSMSTAGETQHMAYKNVDMDGGDKNQDNGRQQRQKRSSSPPVSKGDLKEVTIESVGAEGDGVAMVEGGFVVFVPGTEKGDEVLVRITEVKSSMAFGQVTKQIQ